MTSLKTITESSRKILNTEFITHIAAILLPAVCVMSFMLTGTVLSSFMYDFAGETAYGLATYLLLVFTVAMTVPLLYGYAVFQTNCIKNGKPDFSDMFSAFSCAELYFRSFKVFYSLLWRFAIIFAIPLAFINNFIMYTSGENDSRLVFGGYDFAYTIQVVAIIAASIASFIVFCRFIPSLYITVTRRERPVSECFFVAKIYLKKSSKHLNNLAMSFIPLMLLGIISFGIVLVYAFPLILTSFFVFSHYIYNDDDLSQQTIKMIFN